MLTIHNTLRVHNILWVWSICRLMGLETVYSLCWKSPCWCALPLHSRPPIFPIGISGDWWSASWETTGNWCIRTNICHLWPIMGLRLKQGRLEGGPLLCHTDSICICCSEEIFGVTRQCCLQCLVCGGRGLLYSIQRPCKSTGSDTTEEWRRQTWRSHIMVSTILMQLVGFVKQPTWWPMVIA